MKSEIYVYNTLKNKKEKFVSLKDKKINMYVCGITPYDDCHIGHARCYVAFDIIRRYFNYKGYEIKYIQNFTDIDDKIIKRSNEKKINYKELAENNIKSYFEDFKKLNVLPADLYPKVTEHIKIIIDMIKKIIDNGFAYVVNGEVFFSVLDFKKYGKLSNREISEQQAGSRVEINTNKKHPSDFTLWKPSKENEPGWNSPWGKGRPGWHIECSAMSSHYFNETIDIHGGGQDLVFPHHENEIAQSEAAIPDRKFVNYWLHNGFVTIDKEKMSKSLGNFFLIKDILKKYDAMVLRYFLLSTHYRMPLDFNDLKLEESKNAFQKIKNFIKKMNSETFNNQSNEKILELIKNFDVDFDKNMDNDFNTAGAIGVIHKFINKINKINSENINSENIKKILFQKLEILGLKIELENKDSKDNKLDGVLQILIEIRKKLKETKNYELSDYIRNKLTELNIELRDSKEGTEYIIK